MLWRTLIGLGTILPRPSYFSWWFPVFFLLLVFPVDSCGKRVGKRFFFFPGSSVDDVPVKGLTVTLSGRARDPINRVVWLFPSPSSLIRVSHLL